jgi:hypothetical protein
MRGLVMANRNGGMRLQMESGAFSAAVVGSVLLATISFASVSEAANLENGKAKAEQVCSACHGKDGNTPVDPSYPRLAGQHEDYLRQALTDYRSESRKNAIMAAQAKALTKQEVRDVAAYYASLPGQLIVRK